LSIIIKSTDINDINRLYSAGRSIKEISNELGIGSTTIYRKLKEFGIAKHRGSINETDVISRYSSGESAIEIADSIGVTKITIYRILDKNGIKRRTTSEANSIRMEKLGEEGRLQLTEAAHATVKGMTRTEEDLFKRAKTKQETTIVKSKGEISITNWLRDAGLNCTPQLAIGPYNIDVAVHENSIAVEIFGGNFHLMSHTTETFRKRTDYILNSGWTVVIIWDVYRFPISKAASDYIVALTKISRSNESIWRQEHVINGNGEPSAIGKNKLDYRAFIGGDKASEDIVIRDNPTEKIWTATD
jgi:very-short-patch-repair endonuclease/DNA-binding CsgD family transcriptional regulator